MTPTQEAKMNINHLIEIINLCHKCNNLKDATYYTIKLSKDNRTMLSSAIFRNDDYDEKDAKDAIISHIKILSEKKKYKLLKHLLDTLDNDNDNYIKKYYKDVEMLYRDMLKSNWRYRIKRWFEWYFKNGRNTL